MTHDFNQYVLIYNQVGDNVVIDQFNQHFRGRDKIYATISFVIGVKVFRTQRRKKRYITVKGGIRVVLRYKTVAAVMIRKLKWHEPENGHFWNIVPNVLPYILLHVLWNRAGGTYIYFSSQTIELWVWQDYGIGSSKMQDKHNNVLK